MRRTDNLTTFMCQLSRNLGASNSWNPQGISRSVMGMLYLLLLLLLLLLLQLLLTRGGTHVQITRVPRSGRGARAWDPTILHIKPLRPSPYHSATYSESLRSSVKIFSLAAVATRPEAPLGGPATATTPT